MVSTRMSDINKNELYKKAATEWCSIKKKEEDIQAKIREYSNTLVQLCGCVIASTSYRQLPQFFSQSSSNLQQPQVSTITESIEPIHNNAVV
ncbi:14013_t:CDS:1 [Dentiscutata heterogama]|uniref:14013_t:CDS:1 n=1 Tax=Dentiscutata heterogama TaxID=1316150 RepID=A0ACA9P6V4_9GLOM|nr:14013_t:CDS:1 [Dentiscutata heterogama]